MAAPSIEDVLIHVLPNFGIDSLKAEQKLILECLVSKQNCVAVLPTGFGKSLPFQLYLPVVREISENSSDWKVLVCCPLVALMQDQVEKLSHIANLSAAYKGSSSQIDDNIKNGLIDTIYASPETLVGDPEWRNCLQKLNIKVIVIDEFHTIAIWGQGEGGRKEAFLKWFGNIGELRSLFPEATVLALSATCTVNIRQKVMKVLQLTGDTKEINMSPNKCNIKLVSSKIKNEIEMGMTWLVDALDEKKGDFPRTIIYCSSINDTSKLYTTELPSCTKYLEMFHSETPDTNKNIIIHALKDENSVIRIILSTSALGMGFDVKMCNSVILFGPPNNLVDLLQEIGRVGRDGNPSVAIILNNGYHQQKLSPEVKAILRTKECRRKELMSNFLRDSDLLEMESKECGKYSCCDLCAIRCSCNSCTLLPFEKLFLAEHVVEEHEEGHDDSFSDSDTESYQLSEYDYFEDLDLGLLEIQDD